MRVEGRWSGWKLEALGCGGECRGRRNDSERGRRDRRREERERTLGEWAGRMGGGEARLQLKGKDGSRAEGERGLELGVSCYDGLGTRETLATTCLEFSGCRPRFCVFRARNPISLSRIAVSGACAQQYEERSPE
eukprot:268272-Rhodomonas_salina.6